MRELENYRGPAKDGLHDTIIRYKPDGSTLKIDRCRSGLPRDIVNTRSFLVRPNNGEIELQVILGRFSVEVFVNDGEAADGQALIDVEKYDLIFDEDEEG